MNFTCKELNKIKSLINIEGIDIELSELLFDFILNETSIFKNKRFFYSSVRDYAFYFNNITLSDFSLSDYLNITNLISDNKSSDKKALLNKIHPILLNYLDKNIDINAFPNMKELLQYYYTTSSYLNDYTLGTNYTRESIAFTLYYKCNDKEILRLLDEFIRNEFSNPTKLNFDSVRGIDEHLYGLKELVSLISPMKIQDINWQSYCYLMQKLHQLTGNYTSKNANRGKIKFLLPKLFDYISHNTLYGNLNGIEELKKYSEYLYVHEKVKVAATESYCPTILNEVYSNFPLHSNPSQLYYTKYQHSTGSRETDTLVNLNTDSNFLKELLIEFIEPFNLKKKGIATRMEYRTFIYYFDKSLSELDTNFTCIENFTFNSFKHQFKFYSKLDDESSFGSLKMIDVLKKFYIFLLSYIEINKYTHEIFKDTAINLKLLNNKHFNTMFKQGFVFVVHSPFEAPPQNNKICVVATKHKNARATEVNSIRLDFSKIYNENFREDLRNYLWQKDYNYIGDMYTIFYIVKDFLNLKYDYDCDNRNLTPMFNKNEIFTEDFMLIYMSYILTNYDKDKTIGNIFSPVKAFLNFYKDKYNFNSMLSDYLRISSPKITGSNGGMSIEDFNKVSEEFRKNIDTSQYGELLFIILYLCTKTKLRIGDILSLRRDCIVSIDKKNYSGSIEHFTKTEEEKVITQVPLECVEAIEKAINLTSSYAQNAINKEQIQDIFIIPTAFNRTNNKYYVHSISSLFYSEFYKTLKSLDLGKKYCVYDIRHMRKNEIIKAATKANKDIPDILDMIGGTMQTNLQNYINSKDLDFYIEVFTGTIISNVNIKGDIVLTNDEFNKVKNKSNLIGGCNKENCNKNYPTKDIFNSYPFYKCLQCEEFITSAEKFYIFEYYINEIKSAKEVSTNDTEITCYELLLQLLGVYYKKQLSMLNNKEN